MTVYSHGDGAHDRLVREVRARWGFLPGGKIAQDVRVAVANGIITAVAEDGAKLLPGVAAASDADVLEGDWIFPGLINAHCHLELSGLHGLLPRGRVPFGEWLAEVVRAKQSLAANSELLQSGIRRGVQEMLAGGCTTVVDTVSLPGVIEACATQPLRILHLWEVLGLRPAAAEHAEVGWAAAIAAVAGISTSEWRQAGLAPHAPYSVGAELRAWLRRALPGVESWGWHLHETGDELELFASGGGSIASFLQGLQLPSPWGDWESAPGVSPGEYLRGEQLLGRCGMIAHGNVGLHGLRGMPKDTVVVHCPGTHAFFDRDEFPVVDWRALGQPLALGTDSLASADTLDMWQVVKVASQAWPHCSAEEIVRMATEVAGGSRMLRSLAGGGELGVLRVGAKADMVLVQGPGSLMDLLAASESKPVATIVGGRIAWSA